MKKYKTWLLIVVFIALFTDALYSQNHSGKYEGTLRIIYKSESKDINTKENGILIIEDDDFEFSTKYAKYIGKVSFESYYKSDFIVLELFQINEPGETYLIGDGTNKVENSYYFNTKYMVFFNKKGMRIGHEYLDFSRGGEIVHKYSFRFNGKKL